MTRRDATSQRACAPRSARSARAVLLLVALGVACHAPGGAELDAAPPAPADYVETLPGTGVTFEMVWIPAGGFWIGRTEVTWDEYLVYCAFAERSTPPEGVDAISRPSEPLATFPYDREWGLGRRPAVGLSWHAAQTYCRWLSRATGREYRLPTEAEWRLACGDAPAGPLDEVAWFRSNSAGQTQEVGRKRPNENGLFDMLGNLWEYCGEPYDPAEPEWAVLRGGSFADAAADVTPDARLRFDELWNMADPNVPPGVWWIPDGDHLGLRVLRPGPDAPWETGAPGARDDGKARR